MRFFYFYYFYVKAAHASFNSDPQEDPEDIFSSKTVKYSHESCSSIPAELCSGYSLWNRNDNCYHGTGLPEFNADDRILDDKGAVAALNLQRKCGHHY